MRHLTAILCLTLAVLLGSAGVSESADLSEEQITNLLKGQIANKRGDFATALRIFKPLAEQGDADAQYHLGMMYALGKGVPLDNVYAYMWVNIAASSGDKDAAEVRDAVAKQMTPADISAAQKLTRECVRKNYKGC